MAKNFRDLEQEALEDPRRRANIERERALLERAIRLADSAPTEQGAGGE
ncbi:MAG: hypothetical protein WBQ41_10365 [Solirubrobacterales bacterium]